VVKILGPTPEQVGLGNVTNDKQIPMAEKGEPNGICALDEDSKIPLNATLTFVQEFTNLSEIVVVHNMNKFPSVTVVDTEKNAYEVCVEYEDLNTITIKLNNAISGTIYCN
jgi:hypothetical protein